MVRTANCGDSNASSLGNDAPSVCTVLNRGEEFPRLGTEIVGLGEVTTVGFAGGDGEAGESSSRRVGRRSARRFSLFHWFRRTEDCDREVHKSRGNKARKQRATNCSSTGQSVNLPIAGAAAVDVAATNTSHTSIYSSSGSVDTNCSTATVHSFTFRLGGENDVSENKLSSLKTRHLFRLNNFRKHSSAEEFGAGGQSGNPFDSEASLSPRRAPGESEAVRVSGGESPIEGDKGGGSQRTERKLQSAYYGYRSLPTLGKTADLPCSGKNKAHVRGKRRAPKPPSFEESKTFPEVGNSSGTIRGSHTGRKKRRAPEPPGGNKENGEPIRPSSSFVTKTCDPKPKPAEPSSDAATPRASSIAKSEAGKEPKEGSCEPESLSMSKTSHRRATNHVSKERSVISNDTLKLEGGVLLSAKASAAQLVQESRAMSHVFQEASVGTKKSQLVGGHTPHAAPRPWYKRSNTTLSERDCGSFRRDVLKIPTLTKQRDKRDASRFSLHQEAQNSAPEPPVDVVWSDRSFSRLNQFFGRTTERRDDCKTKKDEKRKSNLSILTNISELDREAAAIVQEEQVRNQAIIARSSSSFQTADAAGPPNSDIISELVSSSIEPQRRGTRALISKFNAIGNITKVTVNATFFTKSGNQSGKIESTKASSRSGCNRNDRIVTKRLLYDGAEQVNETGDISSINFFRRLEAAEANQAKDEAVEVRAGRSSTGWEEKIKRYFPERTSGESQKLVAGSRENRKTQEPGKEATGANSHKQRQSRGDRSSRVDTEFEFFDDRSAKRVNEKANADRAALPSTVEQHLSRADLKEMLIEMKHSLPKRPKPKSTAKSISAISSDPQALSASKTQQSTKKSSPSGSIDLQKAAGTSALNHQSKSEPRSSPALAKPRQQQVEDSGLAHQEKTKVSSGVQTSANLRKVETPSRELKTAELNQHSKYGWKREDTIYTTTGRKNAAAAGLTRNTFQLIRPRDFACIEALKTEKGSARESGQNTYMNVIEDSIYANTVIYPPKGTVENSAEEGRTKTPANDHTKKNHIGATPEAETVRHYTASVVTDVRIREEQPKSEIIPPSASVRTTEGDPDTKSTETNMNTVAINRLLRKLEGAIASGQHQQAAGLAKELAQLKIHCSVVRQRSGNTKASDIINVDMYIEDKLAHQGPIPLQLSLNTSVAELKKKIFAEFEIPENVQRWIIGKNLAENDEFTLNELKAVDKSSIFLYLVAPDLQNDECTRVDKVDKVVVKREAAAIEATVEEQPREIAPIVEEEPEPEPEPEPKSEPEILPQEPTVEELKLKRYEHLMSLENSDLIPNSVPIECPICFAPYGPCEGVILRDCLHMFCRTCIANTIMYCEEAEVKCPFRDSEYTCESTLQEREIKALVTPEIYEQHLAKSVSQAENSAGNNAFHCKTPDCPGWCIYDDNVNVFLCPVCGVNNCLTCQAIHTNKNCREYQDEIRLLKETDQETKRTAAVLEEMVESGEALACPTCAVVLMKKWGCDWLRCSMCKTEICWVTRGPRWGPAGKGDTSGGCKCGENGVKCHPRCNYCH